MRIVRGAGLGIFLVASLAACRHHHTAAPAAVVHDYGGAHVWGSADAGLVDGDAATARFSNPVNVAVGKDGTIFVADFDNDVVRAISNDGIVRTLVQAANFQRPFGLAVAPDGTLYVQTDANDTPARDGTTGTVWRVDLATGTPTVVARNLGRPRGIAALSDGRVALSDLTHSTVSILDPATGAVTPVAGSADTPGFADGSGSAAQFNRPYGLAQASDGALLVADQNNHVIRRVTLDGTVTTFAGTGSAGNDNGPAASASFNAPEAIAVVGDDVYVADPGDHRVRHISGGNVDTFAGDGTAGFVDASGATAEFFGLEGIAAGSGGGARLWIADGNGGNGDPYNRVRFLTVP
jgi:sugar lactone lactonase YvrE